ncbi:MAG: UDP-N-acetylmuramoyl-tripeptide--D-alanyl-D-alanine ligase [Anaerolineae bacterium]|nr:UDP-N-acetylmuramoyl-tripeptide--D-alanyl-D-alanine ligase [Anaerolineae bacterium]
MPTLLLMLIVLTWLAGAGVRVYRQARFFQIEEYLNGRYLRWCLADRQRWLPSRPAAVWFVGSAVGLFLGEAPGSVLPHLLALIAALIAVLPPDEGEIKKKFVATPRAKRLLAAAWAVAVLLLALLVALATAAGAVLSDALVPLVGLAGLLTLLAAPLLLVAGNVLMIPVEAAFRQQFIRRAQRVMADVQPKVIGITGSYGKTTTKNYLHAILSGRYHTYATPKSYNTMMGVCLAINNDIAGDYSVEYFICEMGAYIPGEIQRICHLTPPDISLVIEVGPQHLERFGSLENVAIAKYEIIKGLKPTGLGVFNVDNPYIKTMYERGYPDQRIAVSTRLPPESTPPAQARFIASGVTQTLDGLSFAVTDTLTGASAFFSTPLVGEHNVLNVLLATAVAVHEGMTLAEVARLAQRLQPAASRLVRQVTDSGITIINDAYSANPVGIVSALQVLGLHTGGRRLLITPGMVELGHLHEPENRRLGELATQYATDIILIGAKQTAPIQAGIRATPFPPERLHIMETLSEAVAWYQQQLQRGDTVLFLNDLPDTY